MYTPRHFNASVLTWMTTRINLAMREGVTVRISWLREELVDRFHIVASRRLLSRVLRKCLGAKWGHIAANKGNFNPDSPASRTLRDNFVRKYVAARRMEK